MQIKTSHVLPRKVAEDGAAPAGKSKRKAAAAESQPSAEPSAASEAGTAKPKAKGRGATQKRKAEKAENEGAPRRRPRRQPVQDDEIEVDPQVVWEAMATMRKFKDANYDKEKDTMHHQCPSYYFFLVGSMHEALTKTNS